jgi:hypothetical protein
MTTVNDTSDNGDNDDGDDDEFQRSKPHLNGVSCG